MVWLTPTVIFFGTSFCVSKKGGVWFVFAPGPPRGPQKKFIREICFQSFEKHPKNEVFIDMKLYVSYRILKG